MSWRSAAFIAVSLCVSCGTPDVLREDYEPSEPEATTSEDPSDGGETPEPDPGPEDPSPTEDEPEPPSSFVQEYDGGGTSVECDSFVQDCPAGSKCMPWANDGGSSWNATKCVPIDDEPDQVGEPCSVVDSGVSGVDSCDLAAMCWNVDPETNEGTCIGMCGGSPENPFCDDPSSMCSISCDGVLTLCLPTCNPLLQDCNPGQACYPMAGGYFSCAPDASGDLGAQGDPCEFINVCDPGLACLSADAVGCSEASFGCCSSFCSLAADDCPGDLACVPYFNADESGPGLGDVGICLANYDG